MSSHSNFTNSAILNFTKRQSHTRHDSAIEITTMKQPTSDQNGTSSGFSLKRPFAPIPQPLLQRILRRDKTTQRHTPTLNTLIHVSSQDLCSNILRRSVSCSGLNLLITDPLVVDFLLVCVAASSHSYKVNATDLLPGCPVAPGLITQCINQIPSLHSLDTSSDLFKTLRVQSKVTDSPTVSTAFHVLSSEFLYSQILTWILTTSSFTNLRSLCPPSPHPFLSPHHPLLPFHYLRSLNILPFLVTSQPPGKEALFAAHCAQTAPDRPVTVWHGTHPSRLPLILSHGLRNMSKSKFQSNGSCMGKGVYLSTEFGTSFMYANIGHPWHNSAFRDWETKVMGLPPAVEGDGDDDTPVPCAETEDSSYSYSWMDDCYGGRSVPGGIRVMLGCEVAAGKAGGDDVLSVDGVQGRLGWGKKKGKASRDSGFVAGVRKNGTVYVVRDASRILVRFVFLIPTGDKVYKTPGNFEALSELRQMTGKLGCMRGHSY